MVFKILSIIEPNIHRELLNANMEQTAYMAIQDCLENIETLKTAAPQTNKELQILITDIFEI